MSDKVTQMPAFVTGRSDTRAPFVATGLGLVMVLLTLWFTAGVPGAALGIAVAVISLLLSPPIGFAFAQAGLLAVFPDGLALVAFLLVEWSLLLTLFASLVRSPAPAQTLGMGLASLLGLTSFARLLALETGSAVTGAVFVLGGVGAVLYTIHRFERVELGLTEVSN